MRKKLIELLMANPILDTTYDLYTEYATAADWLIEHGVMIQKQGRWEIFLSDYDDCELMRCSCCGSEFYDGENDTVDSLHNYCPNCGARMDGGV